MYYLLLLVFIKNKRFYSYKLNTIYYIELPKISLSTSFNKQLIVILRRLIFVLVIKNLENFNSQIILR